MGAKQRFESDDEATTSKAAPGNPLGLGLVLVGATALAISMFLPFAQPADGLPIVIQNDSLFQHFGWYLLWLPFLLALFGYQASQGKRGARWSLIVLCVIAAIGVVVLANYKGPRTLYPVGSGGAVDTSHPVMVASLGVAIYVAGAGVAVAFLGALAFFQSAGIEAANVRPPRQQNSGVPETRVPPGPEGNPEVEQAAPQAESSAPEAEAQPAETQGRTIRPRLQSTWPVIAAIVVIVAAVAGYLLLGQPSTTSQPSSQPPSLTPAQAALEKLLLSSDQINTAMGITGLTVAGTTNAMPDDASGVSDEACLPIASPAQAKVYEGSGWSTVLGHGLREPGNSFRHSVEQVVVSFPSAQDAGAFFTAAAQRWPACANRQYTSTAMGQDLTNTVGPVSNTNGTLSVTRTQPAGDAIFTCRRALTVANNVVIDVVACALDQPESQSYAAINIAYQIAAKVAVGNNNPAPSTAPEATLTGPTNAPPVAESALDGLLLSPDPINTAMGTTGLTVNHTTTTMSDINAEVSDQACVPLTGVLIAEAYAGSGWSAFREQVLREPGDIHPHSADQGVVLFSSAHDAEAFFTASAQRWQACANRQYTSTQAGKPDAVYTVGPVSNANSTLGYAKILNPRSVGNLEYGGICQRALTVANNVVIDVEVCSLSQSDSASDAAANIAHQIAAKVPTT